ncbi:MAG: peptide deformylase [Candidatus Hodarchaeales archaeon]|jgi:peptide deformylase
MVKDINQLNQKRNILKKVAQKVDNFQEPSFKTLVQNLLDTAKEYETSLDSHKTKAGSIVGLAANQIWEDEEKSPWAIFVAKVPISKQQEMSGEYGWAIFVNPELKGTGKKVKMTETCMSKKFYRPSRTKRDKNLFVKWQDENGLKYEGKFSGILAIILQHEADHLKGKLI